MITITDKHITTAAFQKAIDEAAANQTELVVEPGAYVLGTIFLRDNLTMNLKKGAYILGSADFEEYSSDVDLFTDAVDNLRGKSLVYAEDVKNVKIYGGGVISGRGAIFGTSHPHHLERPFLVRMIRCEDITLENITLRDSAAWNLHLMDCENVTVKDVAVKSRVNENNDAIDIDACRNVRIDGCDLDTGDDAICLKATVDKPCRNVHVTNCTITTNWAAMKIGTESVGDFEDVTISDCFVYDCNGCGIKICPVDGANAKNITIERIRFVNTTGPIFIANGERLRVYHEGHQRFQPGIIENVTISDIEGDAINAIGTTYKGEAWGNAKSCIVVSGTPQARLKNVVIQNLRMAMAGGVSEVPTGAVPEMGVRYPEFHNFGVLPAWGVYVRHADGFVSENVELTLKEEDARDMCVFEDIR